MEQPKAVTTPLLTPSTISTALVLYCVSGTLLTLANKLAVAALPAPHALLAF